MRTNPERPCPPIRALLVVLALALSACGAKQTPALFTEGTPSPTATDAPSPSPTPDEPSRTPEASPSPTEEPRVEPTPSPSPPDDPAPEPTTGAIAGRVTSPEGEPLWGVCVSAHEPGVEASSVGVHTRADGTYVIRGLEPGRYAVRFSDCYESVVWYEAVEGQFDGGSPREADDVVVRAGERTVAIDATLRLGEYAFISGKVVHEGEPLEGVCVAAYDAETGAFADDRMTSRDGGFMLVIGTAGDFRIGFLGKDCESGSVYEWYDDAPSEEEATIVHAEVGEITGGVVIRR